MSSATPQQDELLAAMSTLATSLISGLNQSHVHDIVTADATVPGEGVIRMQAANTSNDGTEIGIDLFGTGALRAGQKLLELGGPDCTGFSFQIGVDGTKAILNFKFPTRT